jgi:hypothetical protein
MEAKNENNQPVANEKSALNEQPKGPAAEPKFDSAMMYKMLIICSLCSLPL